MPTIHDFTRQLPILCIMFACAMPMARSVAKETQGHWPQFRGPSCNGVADWQDLPTKWSKDKNIAWKKSLKGEGWSAPVIWNDMVFITSAVEDESAKAARLKKEKEEQEAEAGEEDGDGNRRRRGRRGGRRGGGRGGNRDNEPPDTVYRWTLECLDLATGESKWRKVLHEGRPPIPKHYQNTYATETPVTDGKHVYAYVAMKGLYCFTVDGKPVWKNEMKVYPMQAGFGTASSPVVHDDLLFLQIDNESQSYVVAYDKKSGKEIWRTERDEASTWSTPIIWEHDKGTELVLAGRTTRAYNPATGKEIWHLDMKGGRANASPVADGNRLFVGTEDRSRRGNGGGFMFAVKAGGKGDISLKEEQDKNDFVMWSRPDVGPPAASPVVYRNRIYIAGRRGARVHCLSAETGEPIFESQRVPDAAAFWASPWAGNGHVFFLDEDGRTHILKAGDSFEVVGSNDLGELCWSTPSAAGNYLLIRSSENLYAISSQSVSMKTDELPTRVAGNR